MKMVDQLVVPIRSTVLQLAHAHLLGSHLGVAKTQERALERFIWPVVYQGIKYFCEYWPTCLITSPKPGLLVPPQVIEEPFQSIVINKTGRVHK